MPLTTTSLRQKFFESLFGEQEGFLLVAAANPAKALHRERFFEYPERLIDALAMVERNSEIANLWFGVCLYSAKKKGKQYCLPGNIVWADLDHINPDDVMPPPSIVVESSPSRYQAYWRLDSDDLISPLVLEEYAQRLAYSVGADKSGWDCTQLLRVPFTYNLKYDVPQPVVVEKARNTKVPLELFTNLPPIPTTNNGGPQSTDMPAIDTLPGAADIITQYRPHVTKYEDFMAIYLTDPDVGQDWSSLMWRLLKVCAEVGMTKEEMFSVGLNAKCNKYARDKRPVDHLWKEVEKAYFTTRQIVAFHSVLESRLDLPQLVDPDKIEEDSLIRDYKAWGEVATDAPKQYHELSCFMAISALTCSGMYLDLSWGEFYPNLWGLLLGESTLSRKTTAMNMAVNIVSDLDQSLIVASEGSAEGLLTKLSQRPHMVSVFYKDEVSGFFESANRKDYLAGFLETLTQLYDVPTILPRLLRKEEIIVNKPYFIFFGGGIREKVYAAVNESYVLSGFLPRFLVVDANNDIDRIRPTGPPTMGSQQLRDKVFNAFGELKVLYNLTAIAEVVGQPVELRKRVKVELTEEAWQTFHKMEQSLTKAADKSTVQLVAMPTFTRLAFSTLKMSMLIAATRREPSTAFVLTVEKSDVEQAAFYTQQWGKYSVDLILNAGRPNIEIILEKIHRAIRNEPKGVLKSILMQRFRLTSKEFKEVIDTLHDRGLVFARKVSNGTYYHAVV